MHLRKSCARQSIPLSWSISKALLRKHFSKFGQGYLEQRVK